MEVDFGQFYQFAFDALCSILRLHQSEVINRTCLRDDYWLTFQFGYIDPLWVIPMLLIEVGYNKAVERAGLGDFNFHDLRHCAINNLRLAGNDHFLIKQASGHKTDVAFRRYNLVTEDEMKDMKWHTEKVGETGRIDTYMDTSKNL